MTYKTQDLKLAAFLWSQLLHPVRFEGLVPIPNKPTLFFFTFDLTASQTELDNLLSSYTNNETCVEPNSYNARMGKLRDALSSTGVRR